MWISIAIMAGGGITESNAHRVITTTGVSELHARAAVSVASPMRYRNERISMSAVQGREYQRVVVTEHKVRRLLKADMNGYPHPRETSARLA
jgi:copper homeostasis protein CutC